ncbi:LOW QUALITY PROTEIN: G patch domain-containing protein 3 [Mixophyes fleayi]|uniref:LOW QUALITY PROTEIN: G patch domain-containing protein 3 n=1 Tax=Mixophyes fleayi TaxID=3061075 RepID=UPI003F4E2B13
MVATHTRLQIKIPTKMADNHVTTSSGSEMEKPCTPVLFIISGIPRRFRSAQLRYYFSQFTESDGFVCFHYRHRPERRGSAAAKCGTFCCPVTVRRERAQSFLHMYHGKPWLDPAGNQVPGRCLIHRVRETPERDLQDFPYKTRREMLEVQCPFTDVEDVEKQVTSAELLRMSELKPPALMPQGNVGTPVSVFLQLIRSCRLPPRLITRLSLQFPGSGRRYGKVPFVYAGTETSKTEEGVYTATGHEITEGGSIGSNLLIDDDTVEQSNSEDDNDTCEEWERHEALHEDVTEQERCKERLYEEEIELKWEKGGSGLVFYTDAQIWKEQEGDFDEQTADDWDVDMSGYYESGAGDKDAKDFLKMRLETRRRDGLDAAEKKNGLGNFERYTKGVGRKLMERQGWTEGDGLGASGTGMPEALENEGQKPKCRRGLGYHGEKLSTFCLGQKKPMHLISTVYDQPQEEDMGDTLLRRQQHRAMKYRSNQMTSKRKKGF